MDKVYPGQVFIAKHYDQFTESFKTHMFVCVYVSDLDDRIKVKGNIDGLLITSKANEKYLVSLLKKDNKFLEKDSFVDVSLCHRFDIRDISTVIGSISSRNFVEIISKRSDMTTGEQRQCLQALSNMSKYEIRIEYDSKNNTRYNN